MPRQRVQRLAGLEGQTRGGGKANNVVVTSTVDGMVIDVPVKVGFSVIESNNFNPGTTIAIVATTSATPVWYPLLARLWNTSPITSATVPTALDDFVEWR